MNNSKKGIIAYIPNTITVMRIVGTLCLFFTTPFTKSFLIIYTVSAISDALDGIIARATHTTSELGAKLDSIADLGLYFVMIFMIFPALWQKLPASIWVFVSVIVIIRIAAYTIAAIKHKCFASLHSYMNKLAGFMVFLIPYVVLMGIEKPYCLAVCIVAFIAAVEELLIHIFRDEYKSNVKAIFVEEDISK